MYFFHNKGSLGHNPSKGHNKMKCLHVIEDYELWKGYVKKISFIALRPCQLLFYLTVWARTKVTQAHLNSKDTVLVYTESFNKICSVKLILFDH